MQIISGNLGLQLQINQQQEKCTPADFPPENRNLDRAGQTTRQLWRILKLTELIALKGRNKLFLNDLDILSMYRAWSMVHKTDHSNHDRINDVFERHRTLAPGGRQHGEILVTNYSTTTSMS